MALDPPPMARKTDIRHEVPRPGHGDAWECDTGAVFVGSWYLVGPLVAMGMMAALAAVLRWVFTDRDRPSGPGDADGAAGRAESPRRFSRPADFGLLRPVATLPDPSAAEELRDRLLAAGIRSTTATRGDMVHVLVFEAEIDHARRLTG